MSAHDTILSTLDYLGLAPANLSEQECVDVVDFASVGLNLPRETAAFALRRIRDAAQLAEAS